MTCIACLASSSAIDGTHFVCPDSPLKSHFLGTSSKSDVTKGTEGSAHTLTLLAMAANGVRGSSAEGTHAEDRLGEKLTPM